jgi:hypothetical protein
VVIDLIKQSGVAGGITTDGEKERPTSQLLWKFLSQDAQYINIPVCSTFFILNDVC